MATMSPARARGTRRPHLEDDLTHARCAQPDEDDPQPNDWHRADGESATSWGIRRRELLSYCEGCPVIAQCRELALRYDDRGGIDDTVRGGMTAAELHRIRHSSRHHASLAAARQTDAAFHGEAADAEFRELAQLHQAIRQTAQAVTRHRSSDWLESNNAAVRHLTARAHQIRTARRTRAGWTAAA